MRQDGHGAPGGAAIAVRRAGTAEVFGCLVAGARRGAGIQVRHGRLLLRDSRVQRHAGPGLDVRHGTALARDNALVRNGQAGVAVAASALCFLDHNDLRANAGGGWTVAAGGSLGPVHTNLADDGVPTESRRGI